MKISFKFKYMNPIRSSFNSFSTNMYTTEFFIYVPSVF